MGPLLLFAAAMCLTPGPNIVMVTASAANYGFRRAIPHMLGIAFGFGFLVLVVGMGLAGLVRAEPRLHTVLKFTGAAYLLYLAWCIARAGARNDAATGAKPIGFFRAALFQWINPKGWVAALGALATFTTVGGNVLGETLVIALVLAVVSLIAVVVWAAFGAMIGRFLGNPRVRMAFNWSMAALLVLSLIPVFW